MAAWARRRACPPPLACRRPFPPTPLSPPAPAGRVQIQAANPVSRGLFNAAYRSKLEALRRGDLSGGRLGPLWDRLVFSKVKARVGGAPSCVWCVGAGVGGVGGWEVCRAAFGVWLGGVTARWSSWAGG